MTLVRKMLREAWLLITFQVACARFIIYEVGCAIKEALKGRNHAA